MEVQDEWCAKILLYLIAKDEKVRFNNIYNELRKSKLELSKPTLSKHLKHLLEKKFIIREVKDVQVVYYQVNYKRLGKLKEVIQKYKEIEELVLKSKEEFEALPLDYKLGEIMRAILLEGLGELKARIEASIDPSFEKKLEILLWEKGYFKLKQQWLIDECLKDEELREKVLQLIKEDMEKLLKGEVP